MDSKTNRLPGGITKGVARLRKPQAVQINFDCDSKPSLTVIQCNGDVDSLPVSKTVASVLIANGMVFGD